MSIALKDEDVPSHDDVDVDDDVAAAAAAAAVLVTTPWG